MQVNKTSNYYIGEAITPSAITHPTLVNSCKHGGVAADAAPEIPRLTAEMLEAKATDLDDPFAGLDDDDYELDVMS